MPASTSALCDFISIPINVEERHFGRSQEFQIVDRIFRVAPRLGFVLEPVSLEDQVPIAVAPLACAESAWPAFEIADGRIAIDAGDILRIGSRPVVNVESSPAQPHERPRRVFRPRERFNSGKPTTPALFTSVFCFLSRVSA